MIEYYHLHIKPGKYLLDFSLHNLERSLDLEGCFSFLDNGG